MYLRRRSPHPRRPPRRPYKRYPRRTSLGRDGPNARRQLPTVTWSDESAGCRMRSSSTPPIRSRRARSMAVLLRSPARCLDAAWLLDERFSSTISGRAKMPTRWRWQRNAANRQAIARVYITDVAKSFKLISVQAFPTLDSLMIRKDITPHSHIRRDLTCAIWFSYPPNISLEISNWRKPASPSSRNNSERGVSASRVMSPLVGELLISFADFPIQHSCASASPLHRLSSCRIATSPVSRNRLWTRKQDVYKQIYRPAGPMNSISADIVGTEAYLIAYCRKYIEYMCPSSLYSLTYTSNVSN